MTLIPIPIPMYLPPTRNYYPSSFSDYGTKTAIREASEKADTNHKELMTHLKASDRAITVTVRAGDIAQAVQIAFDRLDGPARDYDIEKGRVYLRLSLVFDYLDERKARVKKRSQEADKAEWDAYIAAMDVWRAKMKARPFWKCWLKISSPEPQPSEAATRYDDKRVLMSYSYGYDPMFRYQMRESRIEGHSRYPRRPKGYEDLPAIRDLKRAISLSEDAVLNIRTEVAEKLVRWST